MDVWCVLRVDGLDATDISEFDSVLRKGVLTESNGESVVVWSEMMEYALQYMDGVYQGGYRVYHIVSEQLETDLVIFHDQLCIWMRKRDTGFHVDFYYPEDAYVLAYELEQVVCDRLDPYE